MASLPCPRLSIFRKMTNAELVELLRHPNVWQARTARRLLQERSGCGGRSVRLT
ncbi:MAG: hypothetical protein R3B91_04745 [Planctomycetaceae bacterium]